jgi:prepilin-type N-terminal cleavage/methylation domain-containing protein
VSAPVPSNSRFAGEAGFTLIELVVTTALITLVLGALLSPFILSIRSQKNDANYAYAQQEARTALESMVSQVRQAHAIITPDSQTNSIEMNVTLGGSQYHVFYECDVAQPGTSFRQCVRLQAAEGAALPALSTGTVVARNLLNGTASDPVFSLGPDGAIAPYYMTATLKVPASGGTTSSLNHPIVFSDGALMRNMNVGN